MRLRLLLQRISKPEVAEVVRLRAGCESYKNRTLTSSATAALKRNWDLKCSLVTCCILGAAALTGCWSSSGNEVVVYSALDEGFSKPILDEFTTETGIQVVSNFDGESTKTVGLVNRIIRESNRPRCDLFWNNEILHTLRLQEKGLLDVYVSSAAESFPANYRSGDGTWHGFAARARVLIVNTEIVAEEDFPTSINDLVDPKWKDKVAFAKPLFGTTASHAAVLFDAWGDDDAQSFFLALKQNAKMLSGNKQVAEYVGSGRLAFGLTDTDDAIIEKDAGRPVAIVFPDQGEGMGTLFIPNTVCIIKNGPNTESARKLVDYLLRPDVETQLANGRSAQFPVNPLVNVKSRAMPDATIKWMEADFESAARKWDKAASFLDETFGSE